MPKTILTILTCLTLLACKNEQASPEQVVENYVTYLSNGECEKLEAITTTEGLEYVANWQELGCVPYETIIDSVVCDPIECLSNDSIKYCTCYENRDGMYASFDYYAILEDDEWKVEPRSKGEFPFDTWRTLLCIEEDQETLPDWNVGLEFVNEYKKFLDTNTNVKYKIEWLKNSNYVSENFLIDLQAMTDNANKKDPFIGLDYDPIFVAQDYPDEGFEMKSTEQSTNTMTVQGIGWLEFNIEIRLIKDNGEWIVDGAGDVNPKAKN